VADGGANDAADGDASDGGSIDGGTPDLTVYTPRLEADLAIEIRNFASDSCELTPDEGCVGAAGDRTLLRFSVETPNIGTADIELGTPSVSDDYQFSECHGHFHFIGYAEFRLLNLEGMEVAESRKQAFCLVDTVQFDDDTSVSTVPRYACSFQGIQRGWSDIYDSSLPCQFMDITDVVPGTYEIHIEVNAEGRIEELDTTNNVAVVEVDLTSPDLDTPTEVCPTLPAHATSSSARECGWTHAGDFACDPGETIRLGCPVECGSGLCSGTPMLRVCDATRADGNCSAAAALKTARSGCNTSCPRTDPFTCPPSGMVSAYTAPRHVGDPFTCNVAIDPPPT